MNAEVRPLAEITAEAIEILTKQMGVVATVRFLNQFTAGLGDYTEERKTLLKDLSLDDILAGMRSRTSPTV